MSVRTEIEAEIARERGMSPGRVARECEAEVTARVMARARELPVK